MNEFLSFPWYYIEFLKIASKFNVTGHLNFNAYFPFIKFFFFFIFTKNFIEQCIHRFVPTYIKILKAANVF